MENQTRCRMYAELAWTWPIISPPEDYKEEANQFIEAMEMHAQIPIKTILDMGSGGGHNDIHLKERYKVTGLDMSPAMMANARKLNPEVEYIFGDMRTASLGKTFDAVLLADAVMYLQTEEDLLAALKNAFKHLNPGGVLCTYIEAEPARFSENETTINFRGKENVKITLMENQHRTSASTFQSVFLYLINQNGKYDIEAETHIFGLFPHTVWKGLLEEAGFEVNMMEFHDEDNYPMLIGIRPPNKF